jgi:hypothetical protein
MAQSIPLCDGRLAFNSSTSDQLSAGKRDKGFIPTLLKETPAADSKSCVKQRTGTEAYRPAGQVKQPWQKRFFYADSDHQPASAHLERFSSLIDPRRNLGSAKCL